MAFDLSAIFMLLFRGRAVIFCSRCVHAHPKITSKRSQGKRHCVPPLPITRREGNIRKPARRAFSELKLILISLVNANVTFNDTFLFQKYNYIDMLKSVVV